MADANSNTAAQSTGYTFPHVAEISRPQLADTDVLYFDMANIVAAVNLDNFSTEENLQLASHCEESIAGLCHALSFIGKSFITFADNNVVEFSQESLCQAGHGITAIGSLIPLLHGLERKADSLLSRADKI